MTGPPRPEPDLAQLLSIQRAAIDTLVRHYQSANRRFTLVRTGPDAVFGDLNRRALGKRGFNRRA